MAEQKTYPSQFEKVKAITDQLEAGIQELFNSEKFKEYLRVLSKFHNYSLNNTLLIASQKPDATYVAGYTAWKNQFKRQVQKGETGIKILAPTPYKKKIEVEKIDSSTGQAVKNPDGTTQKETQEVLMPAFKVVNVFDVSQTEGAPLPTLGVSELTGDVARYEMFFEALKQTCPVPMAFEQINSGAKGYFHTVENRIAIQEGMSQVQTVKTAIHEMAHQKLHSINKDISESQPEQEKLTRNAKEVEAESVAYTVCQHYGIETSDYSFAYVAGWSAGKDTPELKSSLDRIRGAANEMITEIDGHMLELMKEAGIEMTSSEVQAAPEEAAGKMADSGLYRYYSTQRPVDIGTYPKTADNAPKEIVNFDNRESVEGTNYAAWGYLEYPLPLTDKQCTDYELRPAPEAVTREAARNRNEEQSAAKEKDSVLADLQKKQDAPAKKHRTKAKKIKEEAR